MLGFRSFIFKNPLALSRLLSYCRDFRGLATVGRVKQQITAIGPELGFTNNS